MSELNGPKFFALWASLNQVTVKDLSYFRIGNREFLAVVTTSFRVYIYEIVNSSFSLFQTLPSVDAHDVESFSLNSDHCLAVASSQRDRLKRGKSELFCWNATSAQFVKWQNIGSRGAVHVKFVSVDSFKFLIFSCFSYNGRFEVSSSVYSWSYEVREFQLFQYLPTVGAIHSSVLSTRNEAFISIYSSHHNSSTEHHESKIFKWNGTYFDILQSFHSDPVYLFRAGHFIFIASEGHIYRYDSVTQNFISHSTISNQQQNSTAIYEYFSINTEHYLAVSLSAGSVPSSKNSEIILHRLEGANFFPHQTISVPSHATSLHLLRMRNGRKVLSFTGGDRVLLFEWRHSQ